MADEETTELEDGVEQWRARTTEEVYWQEHFDRLAVERQAMQEWAEKDILRQAEVGRNAGTAVSDDTTFKPLLDREKSLATQRAAEEAAEETEERRKPVLDALIGDALPKELVLLVLEYVASDRPVIDMNSEDTLPSITAELLGTCPSAQTLRPLLEQVLLENSRIRLDVPFMRQTGGAEPIAQPPPFVQHLSRSIRRLEITCEVEVPRPTRLIYPITVFRLTRGAASLKRAFPSLENFTILLKLDIDDDTNGFVDASFDARCFCGYTATTSYRELLLKMLDAVYAKGPGRRKMLRLMMEVVHHDIRYEGHDVLVEPAPPEPVIWLEKAQIEAVAPHPMAFVLQEASKVQRLAQPPKRKPIDENKSPDISPPSSPGTPSEPLYRQRGNEEMLMLEEETRTVGFAGEVEEGGR